MNLGPSFPFYPDRFMGSDAVTLMDLEAVGAYVLLMIFQWNNGSVPADVSKLAKICKNVSPKKMAVIWQQLESCYRPSEDGGRLVNPFMDELRRERIAYLEAKAESGRAGGIKSGEVRAKQKGSTPSISLEAKRSEREAKGEAKRTSPSPSPSPSPIGESYTEDSPNLKNSPPAEKRGGRLDPAADRFAVEYLAKVGNRYGFQSADFIQLARLRKRLELHSDGTPDGWDAAMENYFASPLARWSLKHFATDFDTFKLSALNQYGKPINHAAVGENRNGNKPNDPEAKFQRTKAAGQRLLNRLDNENRSSDECGTLGGDTGCVS